MQRYAIGIEFWHAIPWLANPWQPSVVTVQEDHQLPLLY